MEVVLQSIAMVAASQGNEFGELKAEVAKRQLSDLQATGWCKSNSKSRSNWGTWSGSRSPLQFGVCWYHVHQKKWSAQQLGAMSVSGHGQSHLFYITNHVSGLKFLIDIGAIISLAPRSYMHRKTQCKGPSLQAINNTTILIYGSCSLTLDLGLRCTFRWVYNCGHFQGNLRCWCFETLWSFSQHEIASPFRPMHRCT